MGFLNVIETIVNLLGLVLTLVNQLIKSNPTAFGELQKDVQDLINKIEGKKVVGMHMDKIKGDK